MRTIQQIIAEITRDVPSARVMGGKRAYVGNPSYFIFQYHFEKFFTDCFILHDFTEHKVIGNR